MGEAETAADLRLNHLLAECGQAVLSDDQLRKFSGYLDLILRWNARVNLTAIRDEAGILSRHIVESIVCARSLPTGIGRLLDFGSGAGFPGIPIALCRPEIAVTLAESQGKKAAFLREVLRTLGIEATIHSGRAEALAVRFDCVTLRAVDQMERAVSAAAQLVAPGGRLVPMTTGADIEKLQGIAGPEFSWQIPIQLPGGEDRYVAIGAKSSK